MKKVLVSLFAFTLMMFPAANASENTLLQTQQLKPGNLTNVIEKPSAKPINNLIGTFDNEIKIFFSDIDGTLIPLDKTAPKGMVQQSVIDGAKELQNANIPMILITGRSSREARLIADKIGIKNQYVIGQHGAEIVNPNNILIYEDGIPSDITRKMLSDIDCFNKKNNTKIVPYIYVKGTIYMFEDTELPYTIDKPVVVNCANDIGRKFTAIKVGLYCSNTSDLRKMQQVMIKKYPKYNIAVSSSCYCDISSQTASKGHAIEILSKKLGVELKNIATIGDAENDISMLKLLKSNGGLAIAVDNANSITKENANYISTNAANAGFLNAVKNVIANNKLIKSKTCIKQ